ncbi:hypothetical protein [Mycobacterium sp. 852002-51057_SCH5723018]|uniref:hypothetical protein n=1 Tax=Mycobacterium sp. 852002-51057_SCH5723018 TaxID=1834094 RepID=UPI000800A686|nr:hypothetical protein [Mycobacterium sp. 852002-51057_SCH5723018]OBG25206.1 hypothetical protein A5764_07370 [Mycobacterium sp. 852002-51057_SCH5723018]
MGEVFVGSEAISAGALNEYQLRRWYRTIFRDVYVSKFGEASLNDRMLGAWLWSRRRAVITGTAASALHGARWVDADTPIELISKSARPQPGLIIRNETLGADEVTTIRRLPVTSVARTAFDLGRHLPRQQALVRLDALMRATPFSFEDVSVLGKRYRGARGLRRLAEVLPLVDGGAASPKESWLRLLLIDAGLPKPTTQIPVNDGWRPVGVLDMGWEDYMVAAEYDGDQHRTDRRQYVWDQRRLTKLADLGWAVIRVIAEDRRDDILNRVLQALTRRGYRSDRR